MKRFTLYGSPHSLPTYKVALMLRLSGQPFSFRYVSFQKQMHRTPEFLALSRWGQVPVLLDGDRPHDAERRRFQKVYRPSSLNTCERSCSVLRLERPCKDIESRSFVNQVISPITVLSS